MHRSIRRLIVAASAASVVAAATVVFAQRGGPLTAEQVAQRWATENELQSIAIVERKVMVPMRDGKRMATDVYRPKDTSKKYPDHLCAHAIQLQLLGRAQWRAARPDGELEAVKRGYAYVVMNERGHFFSEGNYDILGPPRTDGDDAISWIAKQPWSNGKVGTIGCSSTAEWQMGVAALGNPAFAAMIAQGFGAGVGRVGPYYEQGNWYRGGAVQMLFIAWLYGEQNQVTADVSARHIAGGPDSRVQVVRSRPAVAAGGLVEGALASAGNGHHEGCRRTTRHLRRSDAGRDRRRDDQARAERPGLVQGRTVARRHDDQRAGLLVHVVVRRLGRSEPGRIQPRAEDGEAGDRRPAVRGHRADDSIAATSARVKDTIVGERSVGDARLDYDELHLRLVRSLSQGRDEPHPGRRCQRSVTTRWGLNKWQTSDTWPPRGAQPMTLFPVERRQGQHARRRRRAVPARSGGRHPRRFHYDPMNPVPSYGGNVCCTGNAVTAGSFDQRKMEERPDILVYTSEPLKEGIEVSGPIEVTLYVSSDAKDTDFTVKADRRLSGRPRLQSGRDDPAACAIATDTTNHRCGWSRGKVYKVTLQPMTTSNYFEAGHRIRIEVSSSNFPRFDRNLNTGGNNYDEATGVVAHNVVHHSRQYPSQVTVTVVRR